MDLAFKAVILDLDGTLLDTISDIASAMNEVLESAGLSPHDIATYREMVGWGLGALVARALPPEQRQDEKVQKHLREMRAAYARKPVVETRPFPGVPELLTALAHRGIPHSVLSNKSHDLVEIIVDRCFPNHPFHAVRGAMEHLPKKPNPASALEIARLMKARPAETVFVGDSGVDVETARAAGMYEVGVSWGYRTPEELRSAGARVVLGEPKALLPLLGV
jgi:phosphoglycolate phosphatase